MPGNRERTKLAQEVLFSKGKNIQVAPVSHEHKVRIQAWGENKKAGVEETRTGRI